MLVPGRSQVCHLIIGQLSIGSQIVGLQNNIGQENGRTLTRSRAQLPRDVKLVPVGFNMGSKLLASTEESFAFVASELFNDSMCRPQPKDLENFNSFRLFVDKLNLREFSWVKKSVLPVLVKWSVLIFLF